MENLIKYLRESKNLYKNEIYPGIISKSLYDKIEEDVSNIKLSDLTQILERLNISIEEFIYYYNNNSDYHFKLIKEFFHIKVMNKENNERIKSLAQKYKEIDKKSYYMLKSVQLRYEKQFEKAFEMGMLAFNEIESHDTYTPYEIFILSNIFFVFPIEQGVGIIQLIQKKLEEFRDFNNFHFIEISFYLNAGSYLYFTHNQINKSLKLYNAALDLSKSHDLASYTGIAYYMVGYIKNDQSLKNKGEKILDFFDHDTLKTIKAEL